MSQQAPRKIAKAEVQRVIDAGIKAGDQDRIDGMQGLLKLRQTKARVQQNEKVRLRHKYGRQHTKAQQAEKNLNTTVDSIAALQMDITRTKAKAEKPDANTWAVQGHIYDRTGCPIENANVALYDASGDRRIDKVNGVKTNNKGFYQIRYQIDTAGAQQAQSGTEQAGEAPAQQKSTTDASGMQRLSRGLRINSNLTGNMQKAVLVRASLADNPDICADSSSMIPAAGNCNYRDIILNTKQADTTQEKYDDLRSTRYLGNASTRELHDLKNEKKSCRIDSIRFDHATNFKTVKEATEAGYDFCAFCFGKEKSKR